MENKNISILIVDDEEMIVTILMNFLSDKAYDVTGLTDAGKAIDLISKRKFDIVFTDLMMPGINGMELIKHIRSQEVDTQIIIFTGYASVDSAIDAVQQGVYDYIKKPFRLEDIENILIHAAEKLVLQRENTRLHAQVENMLSQITMLYDVSNIIYQVTDKKFAVEMLFDTMAESMGIDTALICQPGDEATQFTCSFSMNVSEKFKQAFRFDATMTLNQSSISDREPTIIEVFGDSFELNDQLFQLDTPIDRLIFIPIRYRGDLEGFLLIMEPDNHQHAFKDELTLLKILATQIAPIISTGTVRHAKLGSTKENEPSRMLMDLIQSEIHIGESTGSPVSFALARLINRSGSNGEVSDFPLVREAWRNRIAEQLGPDKRIHWAGIDTLLIHSTGGNPVGLDHHLANARFELESGNADGPSKMKVSMTYSILTYPFDADSAKKIMALLSSRLFQAGSEMNIKP